ncbi:unnamed protein product [Urochloa decumbens]|uniref:Transcription factor CBF/NF-Y/archaeal histone domain-containing protein n=1 Tax=Urochloa decumbens TaxID=240449 RepID=A0ABC9DPR5_9POAL
MDRRGPRAGASRTFFPKQPAATTKEAATTEPPPVPSADAEPAAEIREQDRLMPVANVSRIMRRALPYHAKISDDAKEVVQDCVSEFISFVTGEANERCHAEHRKTVTAEDIVWAMDRLGFDDYVAPLNAFVLRMRNDSEDGGGGPGGRVSDGRSGGSRRGPSLLEETTTTIRPAVFRRRPLPAAPPPQAFYAVRPVLPPPAASSAAAACFNGRYLMAGGGRGQQQRSVVPHYGGAAASFQGAGNNGAFYADEATSSNEAPAPAAPRAGSRRY